MLHCNCKAEGWEEGTLFNPLAVIYWSCKGPTRASSIPQLIFLVPSTKKSRDNSRENDQNLWKKKKRTRTPSFSPLNLCTNNRLLLLLFPFCLPLASNISIFSQIRIVLTGFQTKVQYYLILLLPEKQFQDCNYKFYTCAKNRTRTLTHSRLIWITKHIHKLLPTDWFRETCK